MKVVSKNSARILAGMLAMIMMLFSVTDYSLAAEISEVTYPLTNTTSGNGNDDKITYSIKYVMNGGEFVEEAPESYVAGEELVFPTPVRAGYKFTGWYSDKEITKPMNKISKDTVGKVKVYAGWKKLKYTVTFVSGADDAQGSMPTQTFTYNNYQTLRKCKFKRENYTFAYWTVSGNSTTRYIDNERTRNIVIPETDKENVILVANWQPNNEKAVYYVKYFNVTNGESPVAFTQKERGKYAVKDVYNAYTKLELPKNSKMKRTGYVFGGWYTDANCRNKFKPSKKTNKCVTVYAKWTSWDYNVVFKKNGGKGTMKPYTVKYGEEANLPKNTLSRNGFTFAGWAVSKGMASKGVAYVDDCGSVKGYIEDSIFRKNQKLKLYAVWIADNNKIEYVNSVGVVESALSSYDTNNTYSFKNLKDKTTFSNLPSYVKQSDFMGWYTTSSYSKKASIKKKSKGNLKFYSKWKFEYEIEFNKGADNATGDMSKAIFNYSKAKALPKNLYNRDGYRFEGWAVLSANGLSVKTGVSGNALSKEDIVFTNKMKTGNFDASYLTLEGNKPVLKLAAVWGKGATITFVTNKGKFSDETVKNETLSCNGTTYEKWLAYGDNMSFESLSGRFKPVRDGYDFLGWFTDEKCSKPASISSKFNGNIVLYASWSNAKYKIRYNSNDGRNKVRKHGFAYGVSKKLKNNPFKRKGYKLIGWGVSANATEPILENKQLICFNDASVSNNYISLEESCISKEFDLYAIWEPIVYEAVIKDVTMNNTYVFKYTIETGLNMEKVKEEIQKNYNKEDYIINGVYKSKSLKKFAKDIPVGKNGSKKAKVFYISWTDV